MIIKTITTVEVSILDLFQFLAKHNALDNYFEAIHGEQKRAEEIPEQPMSFFGRYADASIKPSSWISMMFVWNQTRQGHKYWENLDTEWRKSLGYNNLKSDSRDSVKEVKVSC